MKIVTAKQWGMPPLGSSHSTRSLAVIDEANVHHSASPRARQHRDCASQVRGFDAYHRNHNGWAGIGYHRVICPHGTVYLGRDLNIVPAAAQDHNTPIIAYCLIATDQKATKAQWDALVEMAARDAVQVGRALKWTTHREVWPQTTCPGDPIQRQVDAWRKSHPAARPRGKETPPLHKGKRERVKATTAALRGRKRQVHGHDRKLLTRLANQIRRLLGRN